MSETINSTIKYFTHKKAKITKTEQKCIICLVLYLLNIVTTSQLYIAVAGSRCVMMKSECLQIYIRQSLHLKNQKKSFMLKTMDGAHVCNHHFPLICIIVSSDMFGVVFI